MNEYERIKKMSMDEIDVELRAYGLDPDRVGKTGLLVAHSILYQQAQKEIESLRAERDRLQEALEYYGDHRSLCILFDRVPGDKCTCGLWKALNPTPPKGKERG